MARSFSTLWPSEQPQPPPSSSTEKVLSTYELLENILLHLPMHNIFTIQRVSRQWQSLINRSIPLREKMFLVSNSTPLRPQITVHNRTVYCCWNAGQTLYQSSTPLRFNTAGTIGKAFLQSSESPLKKPIAAFRFHGHLFPRLTIEALPDIAREEKVSWREMFLTEPPVEAVDFMFIGHLEPCGSLCALWNPGGVRFGDLIDWRWRVARELEESGRDARGEIECSFHVAWPGFMKGSDDVGPTEENW